MIARLGSNTRPIGDTGASARGPRDQNTVRRVVRARKAKPTRVARIGARRPAARRNAAPLKTRLMRVAGLPTRGRPATFYFSKGSTALSARDASRLRRLALLQKSAGLRVHVRAVAAAGPSGEGQIDPDALNRLAVSRAKAVATKLWAYGVRSNDMVLRASQEQISGSGRSTLAASRIRRVEIYIE